MGSGIGRAGRLRIQDDHLPNWAASNIQRSLEGQYGLEGDEAVVKD